MAAIFVTSVAWRGAAHYQSCREGGLFKCSSLPRWAKCVVLPVLSFLGAQLELSYACRDSSSSRSAGFSLGLINPASQSSGAMSLCCQRIVMFALLGAGREGPSFLSFLELCSARVLLLRLRMAQLQGWQLPLLWPPRLPRCPMLILQSCF